MTGRIRHIVERIKEGRLKEMIRQTRWIYQYARNYWPEMIIYTLLGLSGTVVGLGSSLISRDLVDIITGHQTGELLRTFAMMIGFSLGNMVISQFTNYISYRISLRVDAEIKSDIFSKMLVTDWESIANYRTGDLLNRWSSDVSVISNGILSWIPNLIINIFRFISAFAVVAFHDISFAVFAVASVPLSMIVSRFTMRRMVDNNKESAKISSKVSSFNQEAFSNIQTIKAFHAVAYYSDRLTQLQQEYISMRLNFQKMTILNSLLMTVVGMIVSYGSYGWGVYRVWSGAITYGTMTLFLSLTSTLTGTLNTLISTVPSAVGMTTSAGRLMDILDMPREDFSDSEQIERSRSRIMQDGVSLEMRNICYAYQGGETVFENASLLARPHEAVALVGPSGEGKTTMLRIILALLKPQQGAGILTSVNKQGDELVFQLKASARKLIAYVPQGNTMFYGTIAENLRIVKPDAADEDIIEALKLACAWEFVEKLPEGINSEIQERGGGFSEGQSQRLAIARALLRKSPILLLDEATSALDVATERRVLKNIMKDDYPRTCIVTTHRPTVLNLCTRVYAIRGRQCVQLTGQEIGQMLEDF